MGRFQGLAQALAVVADRLRSQREAGEEMGRKKELLGSEEAMKIRLLEKEAELSPKEWKPTTQEEAISFEQTKAGMKKGLTLSNALGILSDPMKSTQLKRTYPKLYEEAENVVRANLGEDVLSGMTTPKLPGKVKGKLPTKIVPEIENLMDTNW